MKQAEKTLFKAIVTGRETRTLISTLLKQRGEWEEFRPSVFANFTLPQRLEIGA